MFSRISPATFKCPNTFCLHLPTFSIPNLFIYAKCLDLKLLICLTGTRTLLPNRYALTGKRHKKACSDMTSKHISVSLSIINFYYYYIAVFPLVTPHSESRRNPTCLMRVHCLYPTSITGHGAGITRNS